MNMY